MKCDAHQYADSPRDPDKLIVSCNICNQRYPIDAIEVHLKIKHKIDLLKLIGSKPRAPITTTIENVFKVAHSFGIGGKVLATSVHAETERGPPQTGSAQRGSAQKGSAQTRSAQKGSEKVQTVPTTPVTRRTNESAKSITPRKSVRKDISTNNAQTVVRDTTPVSSSNTSPRKGATVTMDTSVSMETLNNEENSTSSLALLAALAVEQQPMASPLTEVEQQPMASPVTEEPPMDSVDTVDQSLNSSVTVEPLENSVESVPQKSTVVLSKPYRKPPQVTPISSTRNTRMSTTRKQAEDMTDSPNYIKEITVTPEQPLSPKKQPGELTQLSPPPHVKTPEEVIMTTPEAPLIHRPLIGSSVTQLQSVTPSPMHLPATMKRSPSKPMHMLYEAATAALGNPIEEVHGKEDIVVGRVEIEDINTEITLSKEMQALSLPVLKVALPRVAKQGDSWVLSDSPSVQSDSEASSVSVTPRKRGRPPGSTKKVQVVKPMVARTEFCEKCGKRNVDADGGVHLCLPHQCRYSKSIHKISLLKGFRYQ